MAGRWKEDEEHSAAFYVGGHAEFGSVPRDEIVIKISFSLSNLLFFKSFLTATTNPDCDLWTRVPGT